MVINGYAIILRVLGFGFVDDTNLITWGDSAAENCRQLEAAHNYYAA